MLDLTMLHKFATRALVALGIGVLLGAGGIGIAEHLGTVNHSALISPASTARTQVYFLVNSKGFFPGAPTAVMAFGGSGTFQGAAATITGIFTVFNNSLGPNNSIASGSWRATSLVSFHPYGFFSPRVEGGNLTIIVEMDLDNGSSVMGVTMLVNCHIAQPATVTLAEGVYVTGPGFSFSPISPATPLNGITVFSLPPANTPSGTSSSVIAIIRPSIGACNLGCC